ncbi:hypothetical protein Tco_0993669 [Tanacetum coccineum]
MGVTLSGSQGLSSPQANGYVVKASSNPFTFYDSPLPGVNTPWDVMRIVCNPELMDVAEVVQFPTGRYVVPTGRVIATISIKVPAGRYIVPAGYIVSPGLKDLSRAETNTIPEQTAIGKGKSNPFMAGSLPKTIKPT